MAYYYSASERAFFSSELMSVDAMPSDKVAVADQAYKQLMADQVAGKLIRTGSGNAPESVDQGLTAATRFGDVSFGKVTGTSLDINGNGDVSGTFVVGEAVTIKGALNAQGGLNVTSITATGTSTLAAVNATNISASGTLKVNGSSTLQAVSAKKITATEIDLNGSMDASGNLVVHGNTTLEALQANGDATIGGLLKVTGAASLNGGGSVKAPAATVNDASLVSASWVWNLIRRYGLSGNSNTAVEASELWPSRDMNDINATGIYTLSGNWTNSPRGADSFVATGILLHMHRRHNAGPISWQLCVLQTYENIVFYRFNNGGAWSTWFKMAQDGGVVHKTGDEEIAGQKTLQNRLVFKTVNDVLKIVHPTMDGTTIPETSLFSHISFFDKNDNRQAFIQLADRPNGNLELELVLNNGSSDVVKDERIKIGYNKSTKSFYTVAPTPVTSSDDNSIATTAWVRALFEAGLGSAIPSGVAFPYAGKTVPSGFMACNGGTISRTTYAKLFAAIGTAWGAGDGSTTFKLPDWRNRTVMGANSASDVGTYLESGAPNITGLHSGIEQSGTVAEGSFYLNAVTGVGSGDSDYDNPQICFDASRSSSVYGRSEEIQPPAGKALWIIKL